jgi:hypothetical protein
LHPAVRQRLDRTAASRLPASDIFSPAPGKARPSGRIPAASLPSSSQQYLHSEYSAFIACPTSRSSSCPPRRSALLDTCVPILRPLLTPATLTRPRSRGCRPRTAWQQVSPGKNADFPCTPAPSTLSAFDCIGLRCHWPARPTDPASYGVCVPQGAALPPASFAPHLAVTCPRPGRRAHLPLTVKAKTMLAHAKSLRTNVVRDEVEESMTGAPIWAAELALRWTAPRLSPTL